MITDEERESIINEAVERTLLAIPEVIGNLITNRATMMKLQRELFAANPEFQGNRDVVSTVIQSIESGNPGMKYEEVIKKAVPIIKEHLKTAKDLNTSEVKRPSRNLENIDLGEL